MEPVVSKDGGHLVIDFGDGNPQFSRRPPLPQRLEGKKVCQSQINIALIIGRRHHADDNVRATAYFSALSDVMTGKKSDSLASLIFRINVMPKAGA